MNDRWTKADGTRWNDAERDRASRLFRYHVSTGAIVRQPCHFHPYVEGEAHHVDYDQPFLVAWLGGRLCGCHRKADHGSLEITPAMLHDYSKIVKQVPQRGIRYNGRRSKKPIEVPF